MDDGELCVNSACLVGCCLQGQCKAAIECRLPCAYQQSDWCDKYETTDTCATFKCANIGAPSLQVPYDDGCVVENLDTSKCLTDTYSNDCQTPFCSSVTLECAYINKHQGGSCKNGNPLVDGCCLYDGTCQTDPNVCAYVSRSS